MAYAAVRREEEKQRRREDIVDAAERILARSSFDSVTMDQVAREARVSRALVYVYFQDKSDLYFAVCVRALRLLRERFETCLKLPTGLEQVLDIGRVYIVFAEEQPVYFSALSRYEAHTAVTGATSPMEQHVHEAGKAVHDVTVRAIRNGIRDSSLRGDIADPMLVAITLWGFVHGIIQLAQTKGALIEEWGYGSRELVENAIGMCMLMLARGASPVKPAEKKKQNKRKGR